MTAVAQTLLACIATGAVFTSICAALAVPALAWAAVRFLAPAIHKMDGEWRSQAALSAFAASIPGALFVLLVAYGLATGASSLCLKTAAGQILFGALAAMMLAAIIRAITLAISRNRDAAHAVALSSPASPRLARIAAQAGVTAYLLQEHVFSVVMLYGSRKPAVYVSTKALRDLSDEELLAALHHEHAHQARRDHHIAPVLYFLTDLLPLPVADLVATYRRSREFCADACAVRHVAAPDLAAALLRMIAPQRGIPAHAAALVEHTVLHERLRALLVADQPRPNRLQRVMVAASLSAIVAMGLAVPQITALVIHCSRMGLSS